MMPTRAGDVLVVEGKDDQHVLWALLQRHDVPMRFDVLELGGDAQVLSFTERLASQADQLEAHLLGSGRRHVGLVLDADESASARWQSIRGRLIGLGYRDVPPEPAADGTVIAGSPDDVLPTVGIWLMPDNALPGKLEHFVSCLVRDGDPLWAHAKAVIGGVPDDPSRFAPKDQIKALVHTWLAWQKQPGRPLGLAITATYLDADAAQARILIAWVRRLFDLD